MSLLYKCERCTLTHDHEVVPQEQQVIGAVIHLVWPFKAVGGKDTVYLCSDCFREVRVYISECKKMYEDLAAQAKVQAEKQNREDLLDLHDCHASPEDGCTCFSVYDGFGREE